MNGHYWPMSYNWNAFKCIGIITLKTQCLPSMNNDQKLYKSCIDTFRSQISSNGNQFIASHNRNGDNRINGLCAILNANVTNAIITWLPTLVPIKHNIPFIMNSSSSSLKSAREIGLLDTFALFWSSKKKSYQYMTVDESVQHN
ncbi:hypothetical protein BLOT_003305 [Blomia tropicalis]|nr:hypothetical protein BLOT_003305 [Blomia tropicalis]